MIPFNLKILIEINPGETNEEQNIVYYSPCAIPAIFKWYEFKLFQTVNARS